MKNKIFYVLILAFLVFVSFYYGGVIKKNTLYVNDFVLSNLYDFKDYLSASISKHFDQAEQIEILRKKNKELEENSILLNTFADRINRFLEDKNSTQYFPSLTLTRALSYVSVNDYQKVWLDDFKGSSKNRGLIYSGFSAGIAVNKDGRTMALLQGDEKCIFSVYIGKEKYPGIIHGENGKVVVKFIPKSSKIKEGDVIYTSGLDNVFFAGVGVGVIESISEDDMYQNALVKPYVNLNIPSYLYIIEKTY